MKANDLLLAIGDVDEDLVKRAHRENLLRALIASAITLVVGICVTCFLMQPTQILTRLHPDFTVNTGYVDPAFLEGNWTSLEQTGYRDGEAVSGTLFQQMLYGSHIRVEHYAENGETVLADISSGDADWQEDFLLEGKEKIPYIRGMYTRDVIGRTDSMVIHALEGHPSADSVLSYVRLSYLQNGLGDNWVIRQTKLREDGTLVAYRTYDYTDSRLSRTQDYTAEGVRTGYTEYSYEGYLCVGKSYREDGTLTGMTCTKTDWLGRIRWRETYDGSGERVSREVYRYRFWELYRGLEGWMTAYILLILTLTMGIYINDSPITVRERRKAQEREKHEE